MPSIALSHSLNSWIEDLAIKCVCLLLKLVNNTVLCDEDKQRYSLSSQGQGSCRRLEKASWKE